MTKLAFAFAFASVSSCLYGCGDEGEDDGPTPTPTPDTPPTDDDLGCSWEQDEEFIGDSTNDYRYGDENCDAGGSDNCNQYYDLRTTSAAKSAFGPVPLGVYVHGGGWTLDDKSEAWDFEEIEQLVTRGIHVASINYRLFSFAPNNNVVWPILTQDVEKALGFFKKQAFAEQYNVDPDKVFLIGFSAGGQLVAEVGTSPNYEKPAAVVNLCGYAVLHTSTSPSQTTLLAGMLDCPNGWDPDCQDTAKMASADTHISKESAPMLSFYGTNDDFDLDTLVAPYLEDAAVAAEADYTFINVTNGTHDVASMFAGTTDGECNEDVMYDWLYDKLDWHPKGCPKCGGSSLVAV